MPTAIMLGTNMEAKRSLGALVPVVFCEVERFLGKDFRVYRYLRDFRYNLKTAHNWYRSLEEIYQIYRISKLSCSHPGL